MIQNNRRFFFSFFPFTHHLEHIRGKNSRRKSNNNINNNKNHISWSILIQHNSFWWIHYTFTCKRIWYFLFFFLFSRLGSQIVSIAFSYSMFSFYYGDGEMTMNVYSRARILLLLFLFLFFFRLSVTSDFLE